MLSGIDRRCSNPDSKAAPKSPTTLQPKEIASWRFGTLRASTTSDTGGHQDAIAATKHSLRVAPAKKRPHLHPRRRPHPGPRSRREHRDLQRHPGRAPAPCRHVEARPPRLLSCPLHATQPPQHRRLRARLQGRPIPHHARRLRRHQSAAKLQHHHQRRHRTPQAATVSATGSASSAPSPSSAASSLPKKIKRAPTT